MGNSCKAPEYHELQVGAADSQGVKLTIGEPSAAVFCQLKLGEPAQASSAAQPPQDLVIQVQLLAGKLSALYFAAQESFPSRSRKLWSAEGFCSCANDKCDHVYPKCVRKSDGKPCEDCTDPDRNYQHLSDAGALFTKTDATQAPNVHVCVRVLGSDKNLKAGDFFVSIASAEDATTPTEIAIKVFQANPRVEMKPRLGNRGDDDSNQMQANDNGGSVDVANNAAESNDYGGEQKSDN